MEEDVHLRTPVDESNTTENLKGLPLCNKLISEKRSLKIIVAIKKYGCI